MKHNIDTDKIIAALEREPRINLHANPIEVDYIDGVVRLRGEVESIIVKRLAAHVVKSVPGVEGVDDEIRVTPSQQVGDDALVQSVVSHLKGEPVFRDYDIRRDAHPSEKLEQRMIIVYARDGIVRLVGDVQSLTHKRLADVLVWWTPGVADVDNRLRVTPQQQDADSEVDDSLRMVLEKDPSLNQDEIRVQTQGHVVHLKGVVHNTTERELAEKDAWSILGVHDVRNELEVRP